MSKSNIKSPPPIKKGQLTLTSFYGRGKPTKPPPKTSSAAEKETATKSPPNKPSPAAEKKRAAPLISTTNVYHSAKKKAKNETGVIASSSAPSVMNGDTNMTASEPISANQTSANPTISTKTTSSIDKGRARRTHLGNSDVVGAPTTVYKRCPGGKRERIKIYKPITVDHSDWTSDTIHEDNTILRIVQVRSNADSEWRSVHVSQRPPKLSSDNVKVLYIYGRTNGGDRIPNNIIAGAVTNTEAERDEMATNIGIAVSDKANKSKETGAARYEKKKAGVSTKRKVAGLPCLPDALDRAADVSQEEGCLEVTIQVQKDFMHEKLKAGDFYTVSFPETRTGVGFQYNGKYYTFPKEAYLVLLNACPTEDVEHEEAIVRSGLSSEENFVDRKDQLERNLDGKRDYIQKYQEAKRAEILMDQKPASPQCLEWSWQSMCELIDVNVKEERTFVYIAKGTASSSMKSLVQDLLNQHDKETNSSGQGFLPWLKNEYPAVYNNAVKDNMNRHEGVGFTSQAQRGPTLLQPDGNCFDASFFYDSPDVFHQIIHVGSEQTSFDVEQYLHKQTRESSAAAQLTILWERDGGGKKRGNLSGIHCVEALFFNVKKWVENKTCVLNDTRVSMLYKQQISKPFGGHARAQAKGYFIQQADPSYVNFLKYQTERGRLRKELQDQLNAAWDKMEQSGREVKDRSFGTVDDMKRTLEELLSTMSDDKSA